MTKKSSKGRVKKVTQKAWAFITENGVVWETWDYKPRNWELESMETQHGLTLKVVPCTILFTLPTTSNKK
jgi:hypothetical protein